MPSARVAARRRRCVIVALALQVTLLARLPLPGATPDLCCSSSSRWRSPTARLRAGRRLRRRPGTDLVPPADHAVGR